jgi:hypothetical protein
VEPDVAEPDRLRHLGERVTERVRVHRTTVAAIDHEVTLLPCRPAQQPSLGLLGAVASERGDGGRRQGDRSPGARRLPLANAEHRGVQVDVRPLQPEDLGAPHPCRGRERHRQAVGRPFGRT